MRPAAIPLNLRDGAVGVGMSLASARALPIDSRRRRVSVLAAVHAISRRSQGSDVPTGIEGSSPGEEFATTGSRPCCWPAAPARLRLPSRPSLRTAPRAKNPTPSSLPARVFSVPPREQQPGRLGRRDRRSSRPRPPRSKPASTSCRVHAGADPAEGADIQPTATTTPRAPPTYRLRSIGSNRNLVLLDGRRGTPATPRAIRN